MTIVDTFWACAGESESGGEIAELIMNSAEIMPGYLLPIVR